MDDLDRYLGTLKLAIF